MCVTVVITIISYMCYCCYYYHWYCCFYHHNPRHHHYLRTIIIIIIIIVIIKIFSIAKRRVLTVNNIKVAIFRRDNWSKIPYQYVELLIFGECASGFGPK